MGLDEHAEARATANDNAIVRIAHEIRHAVNGWRHGAMVDAFTAERAEVLAAWDELRARTHEEGEAVALILQRRADGLRIPVSHMDEYPDWRDAARTLAGTGEAVLGDKDRYGAYLDAAASRKPRASLVLERLRERIVETRAGGGGQGRGADRRCLEAHGCAR